jgi:hypothetical protein
MEECPAIFEFLKYRQPAHAFSIHPLAFLQPLPSL